jgi:hypothetical protein
VPWNQISNLTLGQKVGARSSPEQERLETAIFKRMQEFARDDGVWVAAQVSRVVKVESLQNAINGLRARRTELARLEIGRVDFCSPGFSLSHWIKSTGA